MWYDPEGKGREINPLRQLGFDDEDRLVEEEVKERSVQVEEDGANWSEERDRNILSTIYYCETCNMVIEPGDVDVARHKSELKHHRMRRVAILKCSVCGNVTTDSYAEYSPERNQFWCRNCIVDLGHHAFHNPPA